MIDVKRLLEALAEEGHPFTIQKEQHGHYYLVHVQTKTVLNLYACHRQKGRIACSVSKINGSDADGAYSYPYDHTVRDKGIKVTDITFSETKSCKRMASDIINRLLPDAIKFSALAQEQFGEHQRYMSGVNSNSAKLVALNCPSLEVRPNKDNPKFLSFYTRGGSGGSWPAGYGDAQLGDEVNLKLHSLPVHIAAELLKLWAKLAQEIVDKQKKDKPSLKMDGTLRYALEQHLESLGLYPNEAVSSIELLANDDPATIKRLDAAAKDYSQATIASFILRANQSASTYLDKTNPDHLSLPILEEELNRKTA